MAINLSIYELDDRQRSLAEITTLSNAMFRPRVHPLRQPPPPTNITTSMDKMERRWSCMECGFKLIMWRNTPAYFVRVG